MIFVLLSYIKYANNAELLSEQMTHLKVNLNGKRILVTGASSGIGRETAIVLAENGAKVILVGRDKGRLERVCCALPGSGHSAYPFDLSQTDDIASFVKHVVSEHGKLNGLFHAAGVECILPINMIKTSHVDEVFAVSIHAGLMLAKAMSKASNCNEGDNSTVFMSSVSAICGEQALSVYAASKGAIESATRALAVELAPKQIRVNSIIAGAVQSEMHQRITNNLDDESVKNYESKHVLGFGEPADIANGALYLLSEASKWVTGSSLVIDGGYACK